MNKNTHPTFIEKIKLIESLEEFLLNYEPKFGEKIKVRRFLKDLQTMKAEQQDAMLMMRLSKIKDTKLTKKDIDLLKTLVQFHLCLHFGLHQTNQRQYS